MPFKDTFTDLSKFDPKSFIAAAEPYAKREQRERGIFLAKARALKDAAAQEIARAQAILKNAEDGEIPDRDQRRIDRLKAAAEELTKWADELEAHDAEMSKPKARLSEPEIPNDDGSRSLSRRTRQGAPRGSFVAMFGEPKASAWRSPAEFLAVLSSGRYDPRLSRPHAFGNETIGGEGGFLVPTQLVADILDASLGQELIRPRARVFPMASAQLDLTAPDRRDRSGGSVGGFSGQWLAEGQDADQQTPSFHKLTLTANKLAVYAQASIEIEQDALDFQATLNGMMGESLSFTLDAAFINGDGIGKPLGILRATNLIVAPKQAGQAAATITYRNMIDMAARLTPGSWRRAVWLASQTTLPELFRLNFQARDDAGAAIPDEAVAAPVFSVSPTGDYLLLGRPLLITEHAETLGVQGDICLADLNEYAIGLRQEAFLERNNAPGWTKGLIDYRLIVRVDGRPRYGNAVTPAKGATVSPFVVLQAR